MPAQIAGGFRSRGCLLLLVVLLLFFPHGSLEVLDSFSKAFSKFANLLATEQQHRDAADDQKLGKAQAANTGSLNANGLHTVSFGTIVALTARRRGRGSRCLGGVH